MVLRVAEGSYTSAELVGGWRSGGEAVVEVAPGDSSRINSRGGLLPGLL